MTKILNIMTIGLKREGIVSTQLEYMKRIDKEKFQVDIAGVHNNAEDVVADFEKVGCRVIVFPDRYDDPLKYMVALYKAMKREKYDVVHVHGSSALLLIELIPAVLAGVKTRIAHSRNTMCKYEQVDKLLRPIFYQAYTKALACGQEAGEFLFPNRPFTVLHNGKDFTKFCYNPEVRANVREKLQLGDKVALGFVGNLNDQKNPFFLVDILADLLSKRFNTQLVLIGDGHLQDAVKQYATEKNVIDYITFTGRVSNVHEYIQALDIMLLPSLYEGLPNVVLEWQIAGLPSLVSDKVTRECKVTDLVSFLPIDQGAAVWADQIMAEDLSEDREVLSKGACELMKQAGFEIGASCKELERIYSNL